MDKVIVVIIITWYKTAIRLLIIALDSLATKQLVFFTPQSNQSVSRNVQNNLVKWSINMWMRGGEEVKVE